MGHSLFGMTVVTMGLRVLRQNATLNLKGPLGLQTSSSPMRRANGTGIESAIIV